MNSGGRRYFGRSRISDWKMREIIRYFSLDIEVSKISLLVKLDRKVVSRYVQKIRRKIVEYCESVSRFDGEVECDESYFGGKKKGDKRGR